MDDIQQLADEIYRDRVRRAREMTAEEKLLAGPRLFEYAREIAICGIRSQHPDADEAQIRRLFQRRMELQERIETAELGRNGQVRDSEG